MTSEGGIGEETTAKNRSSSYPLLCRGAMTKKGRHFFEEKNR